MHNQTNMGLNIMKVNAISRLGFIRNDYSFGEKQKVNEGISVTNPSKSSDLAKVPVVVLLAMNPATLSSAIPMSPEGDNPNHIVMITPGAKALTQPVLEIEPEIQGVQQSDAPYGWVGLKRFKIQKEQHGMTPLYEYDMLFATSTFANGDYNKITDVFVFRDFDNPSSNPYTPPRKVKALYYHNTGDGKDFYGVLVAGDTCDKNGKNIGYTRREFRVEPKTGKAILDLITNRTKWEDCTDIKYYVTKSPSILDPEDY